MSEQKYKKYIIEFKLYDGTTRNIPIDIPIGEDGGYYTPAVNKISDTEIEISYIPSAEGMPKLDPVTFSIEDTVKDIVGKYLEENPPADGKDGLTPHIGANGNWFIGEKDTGVSAGGNAEDGFSPTATVEQTSTGVVVSITDKTGTTTATITNGKDGKDGADGQPGKDGKDYVLTSDDKTEIAEMAAELVDVPEGSGSGIHIGTEAPTDKNVNVWIDTDEEAPGGGNGNGSVESAPADWNAAEGEPGHVLNRTHWTESGDVELYGRHVTSVYDSDVGFFIIPMQWHYIYQVIPQTMSVEFDGVKYDNRAVIEVPSMGNAVGNLYYLNSMAGTSFENTGEPFLMFCGTSGAAFYVLDTQETEHVVRVTIPGTVSHRLPVNFTPYTLLDMNELGLPPICDQLNSATVEVERDCIELIKELTGLVMVRFTDDTGGNYSALACPVRAYGGDYVVISIFCGTSAYMFKIYKNKITGQLITV